MDGGERGSRNARLILPDLGDESCAGVAIAVESWRHAKGRSGERTVRNLRDPRREIVGGPPPLLPSPPQLRALWPPSYQTRSSTPTRLRTPNTPFQAAKTLTLLFLSLSSRYASKEMAKLFSASVRPLPRWTYAPCSCPALAPLDEVWNLEAALAHSRYR